MKSRRSRLAAFSLPVFCGLAALACGVSASAQRRSGSGGDISGGGGGCARPDLQESAFLADFASVPARFRSKIPTRSQPGSPIALTPLMARVGFDWIALEHLPAAQFLERRLALWTDSRSSRYIGRIRSYLGRLSAAATPYRFAGAPRFLPSQIPLCPASSAFRAAIYYNQRTLISIPAWNRFDLVSQAGLLLHEALRHPQLKRFRDESDEGEERLREIVYHVLLFSPGENSAFDLAQALEDFFLRNASRFRGDAETIRSGFCARRGSVAIPLDGREGLLSIERLRARDCSVRSELIPRSPGRQDEWGRRCLRASAAAADSDVWAEFARAADRLHRTQFSLDQLRSDVQSTCRGRIGPEWAEQAEAGIMRMKDFVFFAYAGLGSPLVAKFGRASDRAAIMSRWIRDSEELHALAVYAMLYENERLSALWNGLEDVARSFESLASKLGVGRRISEYLEGRLPVTEKQKNEIEAQLDQLRDGLRALIEQGALIH